MKKLFTIITVFFIQISFSQSSDFVRPTVSFVVAPYNNGEDIGRLTDGSFASFDLLKLQNGQLGISANPKKNKVTDEYNEAATNVAKSISGLFWDEVFAINAGTPDYSKMMQRAANTMTEKQRAGFVATMQGLESQAKNQLIEPLLDATYIVVLSPHTLTTDVGKKTEGYQTDLSWAVFKIDLARGMNIKTSLAMFDEKFSDNWNDVKTAEFPVKLIASGATTASSTQSTKDVLDTKIRPAVARDGGDIKFKSFEKGVVKVELQGSCSGCPSSLMTLKQGVQNLLKHYVKEVNSVEAN